MGDARVRLHVEAAGLVKRFGSTPALDGADLAIASGALHALVGRNGAGKSTLVSILTGLQQPDAGTVAFDGKQAPAFGDRDAWRRTVACVYQHSMIVPQLSVAENIFLNRYPRSAAGTISWHGVRDAARELLHEWQIPIDVDRAAETLGVEERQLVEIVRALSFGARFIILDEPTAHLESSAIARLFAHLRALNQAGVTILFISHHLQEIYDLCDTVSVFRDAKHVWTRPVAGLAKDDLIEAMTGERGGLAVPRSVAAAGTRHAVLDVQGLSGTQFDDVTLRVHAGEIVGLAGIGGSGKIGVAETVAGLHRATRGAVLVDGKRVNGGSVRAAIDAGIGFVPRDRHRQGLVLPLSVGENATMPVSGRLGRAGFIQPLRRKRLADTLIERLGIRTTGAQQGVSELSGGNQQKVVFARALASEPKLLLLIAPTAGVDVKSKEALLRDVASARERGMAVLIVSDEMDDLRSCDRVLVMFGGKIVAEMPAGWNERELIACTEGVGIGR
ncbi:MAG: sugar ABC transporter ATP-binding protein [Vulcanimicrobiaceae bacterium]